MKSFLVGVLVFAGVLSAFAEENPWSFSAGYKHRYNIDTDVRGGASYSAQTRGTLSGQVPVVGNMPPEAGFADRDYDDGFVYRDDQTENPGALAPGATGYFGYQDASQVQGGQLLFSRSASVVNAEAGGGAFFQEFEDQNNGVQLTLNYRLMKRERLSLHAVASFSYFPEQENKSRWSDYSAIRTTATSTDRYDLNGVDPSHRRGDNPDPNDPDYNWLENYDPNDPRPHPLIGNVPTDRVNSTSDELAYRNDVRYDVDYDMATFGLGLELQWEVHDRVSLYVSPRLERYRMDIDASRVETLSDGAGAPLDRWTDKTSAHEYFWGMALEGGVQAMVTETWFVRVHGEALQTWDSVEVKTGPTTMSMDMSGWSWGVDLGVTF